MTSPATTSARIRYARASRLRAGSCVPPKAPHHRQHEPGDGDGEQQHGRRRRALAHGVDAVLLQVLLVQRLAGLSGTLRGLTHGLQQSLAHRDMRQRCAALGAPLVVRGSQQTAVFAKMCHKNLAYSSNSRPRSSWVFRMIWVLVEPIFCILVSRCSSASMSVQLTLIIKL